ncbi:hypothetical protein ACFPRL_28085 [Pseudoclavibacter helvolus]
MSPITTSPALTGSRSGCRNGFEQCASYTQVWGRPRSSARSRRTLRILIA